MWNIALYMSMVMLCLLLLPVLTYFVAKAAAIGWSRGTYMFLAKMVQKVGKDDHKEKANRAETKQG